MFAHPSAEHSYLRLFLTLLTVSFSSSSSADARRFLLADFPISESAGDEPMLGLNVGAAVVAASRRVEVDRRFEADVLVLLFSVAAAAAASFFLSWLPR